MKVFFDTNILVYRVDYREPAKRAAAENILNPAVDQGRAVLSTQTLQECYNASTRKLGMPPTQARAIVEGYARIPTVTISTPLIVAAMQRHAGDQFSFWDALIVEAALSAGCKTLYSEDMQHGRVVDGMTIENPFVGL